MCQSLVLFGKNFFPEALCCLKSQISVALSSNISWRISVYMHIFLIQALAIKMWELDQKPAERQKHYSTQTHSFPFTVWSSFAFIYLWVIFSIFPNFGGEREVLSLSVLFSWLNFICITASDNVAYPTTMHFWLGVLDSWIFMDIKFIGWIPRYNSISSVQFRSVASCVQLFGTPWSQHAWPPCHHKLPEFT